MQMRDGWLDRQIRQARDRRLELPEWARERQPGGYGALMSDSALTMFDASNEQQAEPHIS